MTGKITQAAVYLNGAQITRTETFKLKTGVNRLVFESLPAELKGESITASSDGKCAVLSVSHNTVHAKAQDKRISDLHARLVQLRDEENMAERKLTIMAEEEELLRKNTRTSDRKEFRADDMMNAVAFFRERMAALCGERFSLEKSMETLREEIDSVESEIGMDEYERMRSRIEVEVCCERDTGSEITISYFTYGARWTPYYNVSVKDVESPLKIEARATVYQSTGEDWKDVNLILSTGNPSLGGDAPELRPWYLNFFEAEPLMLRSVGRKASKSFAEQAPMSSCQEEMCDLKMELEVVQTESTTSVEYTLPVPYTVLSSDIGKSVDIMTHELKAEYTYRSVIKLEKDVFLVAEVNGWEHLNLLAGPASVFFEDMYVGKTHIDPAKAEENFCISLGRDKNIIVTRTRGKDHTAKSTIGSSMKASREWVLAVKNLRKQKITITLEDQVPVSANSAITVDVAAASGAEYDKEKGILKWKMTLDPTETRTFSVKYTVTYPKNRTVILE